MKNQAKQVARAFGTTAEAIVYLAPDELSDLHQMRPWAVVRAALFTWGLVLGAIWLWAYTQRASVLVAAFVIVATRQHALNNLVHEAAHYSVSRDKRLNDWISDVLFAAPHLISTSGYRDKHMLHHVHLGKAGVDTEIKPRYLIRGSRFVVRTAGSLFGHGFWQATQTYIPSVKGGTRQRVRMLGLIAVTNGALLTYCWWLAVPAAYVYLWLLPLVTLTLYLGTLRVIAEHQPGPYALERNEDYEHDFEPLTRSIPAGRIERFFLSPVNFCYHHEHHCFPGIPYSNLPRLHRLLLARGYFEAHPECLATSYRKVLMQQIFPTRQRVAS
jgi:fatty acid desaturase